MSTPASTCGHCQRNGTISRDQRSHSNSNGVNNIGSALLTHSTRFWCPCGAEWTVITSEALAHGEFLDKAGLR